MKKRPKLADRLWAGSEESLEEHLQAESNLEARLAAGWSPDPVDDEEEALPYLLNKLDSYGVVKIHGAITNGTAWYDEYLGRATYPAIRDAVMSAALDPDVSRIILDINSPGGTVSGVSDCADLIAMVNDEIKPVVAFTDGMMCSAAYWLGCAAGDVFASQVSTVGSIGVIAIHQEYSKAMQEAGITATVLRAGKYKALASSVEPLSDEARTQMQASLDSAYEVFVQHIAAHLDQPYDYVDQHLAQGREFFGQNALAAGLVSGITTWDRLMSALQAQDESASPSNPYALAGNGQPSPQKPTQRTEIMKRKALTAQAIAAMAAGVPIIAAEAAAPESVTPPEVPNVVAETPENVGEGVGAVAADANAEAVTPPAPAATADTLTTYLQAQINEKDAKLVEVGAQLIQAQAALSTLSESVTGMATIVGQSINNMAVAMNMAPQAFEGRSPADLLAAHAQMSDTFQNKFKVGGVAAVDAAALTGEAQEPDAMFRARLDSVRPLHKS